MHGKTILLHAEQGFGDIIQFIRYLPMVVARGGKVVLEIPDDLKPLIGRIDGVDGNRAARRARCRHSMCIAR